MSESESMAYFDVTVVTEGHSGGNRKWVCHK